MKVIFRQFPKSFFGLIRHKRLKPEQCQVQCEPIIPKNPYETSLLTGLPKDDPANTCVSLCFVCLKYY